MGVLVLLTFGSGGGVVQNRESPDFRSPEVGRYDGVSRSEMLSVIDLSRNTYKVTNQRQNKF